MKRTASDTLVEVLIDWGVEVIFGLPGDGINGIMEALRKAQDKIKFIHVRHEETAAFMACSYAKFTGKIGCCLATSGPGGIHCILQEEEPGFYLKCCRAKKSKTAGKANQLKKRLTYVSPAKAAKATVPLK